MIDSIGSPFKDFSDKILKVVIEDGVTSIGENAFDYCTNLTAADISDSVITISDNAFLGCKSLTSIVIGNGVITIGEDAFRSCKKLNNVTMGSNVKTINRDAFSGCTALASIVIPDGVTTIGDYAFELCESLTSITIPDSVISVGTNTFNKCENLAVVKIGNKVPAITEGMFYGCTSLVNITLGNGVVSIDKNAFQSCTALTSISIPESVTTIKENAFLWCDALSSIVLPDSVISVGNSAFLSCDNLKKVTLSNGTGVIEEKLFENSGLKAIYIPKEAELVKKDAFNGTDLAYVYYGGSEDDKNNLIVLENNEMLADAKWVYNATELPEHIYADECDSRCEICESEREAPHAYGDYISDNNATTEADGTKTRECLKCGNKETVADVGSKILSPAELTEIFSAASDSYFSVFLFEEPLNNEYRLAAYILSKYYQEIAEYSDPDAPHTYNVPKDVFEALVSKTFETNDDDIATLKESEIYRENEGNPYYVVSMIEMLSDEPPLYYGYKNNGNNQYTLYAVWFGEGVEETEQLDGEDGVDYVKYYGYKFPIDYGYALDVTLKNGNVQYKDYTVIEETDKLTEIAKTIGYVRYDGTVVAPHVHEYTDACDTSCNTCGEAREISHSYGEYISNNDATTEKDGTKTRTCSVCGNKETVTDEGTKIIIEDTSKVFEDIPAKKWFKEYVDYSYTFGIFTGTSKTEFSPNDNITRAQFVQVLANLEGVDTSDRNVTTNFSDVPAKKWFTAAVKWASENKIVNGVGDGKFDPEANVTREQMCVMLTNYAKFKGITLKTVEGKENFADDNKISKWAKTAVYTCQQADIVNGKGAGKFDPQGTGTRAEASVIFTKFHKEYLKK